MKNNQGQLFLEILMAIAVVGVILIAVVGLVTQTVSNTSFSENKSLGNHYTQEAVEWIRGQRDGDWSVFYARAGVSGTTFCFNDLHWVNGGVCALNEMIIDTPFYREVTLTSLGANAVEVLVVTRWSDGSGDHEARVTTEITNWRTNL